MKRENYINFGGWMVTDLGLHGDKLMAYAIIYGMTQDGAGWYCGGRSYIAEWLGCGVKKAGRILSELVESGLIVRAEAPGKSGVNYKYQAAQWGQNGPINRAETALSWGQNGPINRAETALSWGQNGPINRAETAHITTMGDSTVTTKGESRRFAPPTRDEVEAYASEKGYRSFNADRFIDYYESNGWRVGRNPMKDWRAAVRSWASRDYGSGGKPGARLHDNNVAAMPDDVRAMLEGAGLQ